MAAKIERQLWSLATDAIDFVSTLTGMPRCCVEWDIDSPQLSTRVGRLPSYLHYITFDLQGAGWTPYVIGRLGDVVGQFSDVFSKSKTDFGSCCLLPFEI